jgi:hypothetical protein
MANPGAGPVKRVVIMVQENHTTDNYFRGLAPWGANVATDWPTCLNPPPRPKFSAYYPPHHRHAYFEWLMSGTAEHSQFDTAAHLPYYLYLAITGAFLENHCAGFGTNSTPNHLLLVGGQSPTLTNPPPTRRAGLGHALAPWTRPGQWRLLVLLRHGGLPGQVLPAAPGLANIVSSSRFVPDAKGGQLPSLVYLWHGSGMDEHPPANITEGMNAIWEVVDEVVQSGGWDETVFMLTWDDWGGFDDHVATPATEYTPDNVKLAYGPRVLLLVFGGHVKPGIDSRRCSHVSIPKTAIQLLGLPDLGVPRLDADGGLADLVDLQPSPSAPPPGYQQLISMPPPPTPSRQPNPLPPPPPGALIPVGVVALRDGTTLPPPDDAPLPHQSNPPNNAGTPMAQAQALARSSAGMAREAKPADAQATAPNQYHLEGGGISISFYPAGFGPVGPGHIARLTYQDAHQALSFTGNEIRTVAVPDLGTVVSVTLVHTIDVGDTTFSVLLPNVNVRPQAGVPANVQTDGITTVHRTFVTSIGQAQAEVYTVILLSGTATRGIVPA